MNPGSPRHARPPAEDRPVRRTWWLLSGTFLLLAVVTLARAVTGTSPLDWLPVIAVAAAAAAAILHRNAVAGLESRGRAEAENFARILQGLSRSVSVEAIVGAIVDDLAEGTGADHVVVVRKRPESGGLEATLVTRRPGVPSSTTLLPAIDLDPAPGSGEDGRAGTRPGRPPIERGRDLVAVPVAIGADVELVAGSALAGSAPGAEAVAGDAPATRPTPTLVAPVRPEVPAAAPVRRGAVPGRALAGRSRSSIGAGRRRTDPSPLFRRIDGTVRWIGSALDDLGITDHPFRVRHLDDGPRSEILGTGPAAVVTSRITERVRTLYGLSQTISAPLRTEHGLVGAIVISRRNREPWPDGARRVLEGASVEAAAAMARAYSYREATANATTDPLTGLPNRRYFDEFCGLLARRRRTGDAVAVLMIDIDRFKVINDRHGHAVGDEILRAVAGAIVTAVRDADVPARVGGEEFAVLLRNPGPEVAVEIGERVRAAVAGLDVHRHGLDRVTVSVGVANARGADEPILGIVERADRALYQAKRAGRDRVTAA